MFKLVTGSPGEGKTSNELWEFLHDPAYTGRPKYCTPVNGFEPEKHGVKPIVHISEWQDLPDGSVIFCDEIQDFCGTDIPREPPEWVKQLARHRHRGFDFIATTQSPMFLHPFVRKLAKPHVHYSRPWNMKGVRYTFENVQNDPNSRSSKALGQRHFVTPNPEVFKLYTSTVLDTHKAKPPKKLIIMALVTIFLLIAGAGYAAFKITHFGSDSQAALHKTDEPLPVSAPQSGSYSNIITPPVTPDRPVWSQETVKPRISGQPYTAPIYDNLTAPTDFPRVAGCMSSKERGTCKCYSQQATPIDVPMDACLVFVKVGTFDPWLSSRRQQQQLAIKPEEKQLDSQMQPKVSTVETDSLSHGQRFTVIEDSSRGDKKSL